MYHFAENFLFSETPLKGFPAITAWSWVTNRRVQQTHATALREVWG
jgi:hypothetical protein